MPHTIHNFSDGKLHNWTKGRSINSSTTHKILRKHYKIKIRFVPNIKKKISEGFFFVIDIK